MVRGALSSWSPFLGCLSGSSELAWGSVEPLRTCKVRCSALGRALHPSSASAGRLGLFHAMSFPGSLSWSGGVVFLCFRHEFCGEDSGPSLAPRFAGFTVPAQPTRDNRNGRPLYPVRAVRYSLVHFGCASSAMQGVPLLPQGITGRSY